MRLLRGFGLVCVVTVDQSKSITQAESHSRGTISLAANAAILFGICAADVYIGGRGRGNPVSIGHPANVRDLVRRRCGCLDSAFVSCATRSFVSGFWISVGRWISRNDEFQRWTRAHLSPNGGHDSSSFGLRRRTCDSPIRKAK